MALEPPTIALMIATEPHSIPDIDDYIGFGFLGLNVTDSHVGLLDGHTGICLEPLRYLLVKKVQGTWVKFCIKGL